jgi:hypothetical protein
MTDCISSCTFQLITLEVLQAANYPGISPESMARARMRVKDVLTGKCSMPALFGRKRGSL